MKFRYIIILTMTILPGLITHRVYPQDHAGNHWHAAGQTVIFSSFPGHIDDYRPDIAGFMDEVVDKYGAEEWRAVVLTSEMHTHLGIYAIIGAKMGVFAREYFGAGIDHLSIVSHAGDRPPISCLNDGLQCSTGATLGHGLLTLATDEQPVPAAEFRYKDRIAVIELHSRIRMKIKENVDALKLAYGLESEQYWLEIRNLALHYWQTLDRKEIFQIMEKD